MSNQVQMTPDMKNGSAKIYLEEREQKKKILDKLEKLNSDVEIEKLIAQDNGYDTPIVETTREIIEHFNRGKGMLKAFDAIGYFLYQGAIVCEAGKKEEILDLIEETSSISPIEWKKKQMALGKVEREFSSTRSRRKRVTEPAR